MDDESTINAAERLYGLLARSFVRYVIEESKPLVLTEWDRRVFAALSTWNADNDAALVRIEALLQAERIHASVPLWNLEFSQYHMVAPVRLLQPLLQKMEATLSRLRDLVPQLGLWTQLKAVAEESRLRQDAHLANVRRLESQRPKDPPKPGVKKGVSANFW